MTDKVQKIRKEVEKLKSNLIHGACSSQVAMETMCKEEAYNEVLALLDSMQEEPVSEELEEAADNALESISDQYDIISVGSCLEMFRLGAKWDKEQMIAKAIDGYVIEDVGNGNFLLSADYLPKSMNLKDEQDVKVIVIRED